MPAKISWSTLSLEELREERKKVLSWLDDANKELRTIRRHGARGEFLPQDAYEALMDRRTRLVRAIRGLELELHNRREQSEDRYNEAFYQAADELLDDILFNKVRDRTEEILNGNGRDRAQSSG